MEYTGARVGDRTMMDALIPFVKQLRSGAQNGSRTVDTLRNAVNAAQEGYHATAQMESRFGRSTYVDISENAPTKRSIPDPGACGVVAILKGILQAVILDDQEGL